MTDARERVAMALQAAEANALEKGAVPSYAEFADAAIAAHLEALGSGGYAVVALPESNGQDEDGQEYFGDFGIRVDHTGRGTEYPRLYIDGRPSDPEAARREAADLLAAAAKADSELR